VLPDAELQTVPDAGHWPWLDRPELVARIVAYLGAD
jgi:pimeloyl-ACP methyl ester carboxylesterase